MRDERNQVGKNTSDITPGEVVTAWIRLYGQDTGKAALLTTERFRNGEDPQEWTRRIQSSLHRQQAEGLKTVGVREPRPYLLKRGG